MSFGKKILEKYGYKEGSGLGKNTDGIVDPIKAQFKFDNSGFGDKGPVRDDHWWERVFNEASSNLDVESNKSGTISINMKDKDGVEITNKSYSLKKLKESNTQLQYGNFLKSATLLANVGEEKEIEGHVTTNDIEIKPIQVLTDEELLKACDFRTAHKGARHGLNLNGKLQRIAEQEKLLLEKMKENRSTVFKQQALKRPLVESNISKDDSSDDSDLPINLESESGSKMKSKKQRMRDKKRFNALASNLESIELKSPEKPNELSNKIHEETKHELTPRRKKKAKKNFEKLEGIIEEESSVPNETISKKKKKAKKRTLDDDEVMPQISMTKAKTSDVNVINSKRVKLKEVESDETDDEVDAVDKINEIHHQNMRLNQKNEIQSSSTNFESSLKKKKKGKINHESTNNEDWNIKKCKKMEKYERKKLKYQLKQQKLAEKERRKQKKHKKKDKKKLAKNTDIVIEEIDSVGL